MARASTCTQLGMGERLPGRVGASTGGSIPQDAAGRLLNVLDGVLLVGIGVHGLWRNRALIGAFLG